ncbi:hypothetical protein GCM10023084_54040 [Streptomyces lacrimifluminis]|uniref:Uncharacterized protein n=1 Tax=Streptomyces lacrimifluminis TaxID=1500077 RepID=A0A917KZ78_9ACTN|nr:hypothetical protein [Streptomyces lacrimifluminis]GGJ34317.1 hypothetical protein GCM10012282_33820 [Streptomyces lacrimifluminis]
MSDLIRYEGGSSRAVARRSSRAMQEIQQRGELDLAQLINSGRQVEARAMVRRRLTEDGMTDVADVGQRARELARGDQFLASLLIPIVQEFAQTTARDIREFGRDF